VDEVFRSSMDRLADRTPAPSGRDQALRFRWAGLRIARYADDVVPAGTMRAPNVPPSFGAPSCQHRHRRVAGIAPGVSGVAMPEPGRPAFGARWSIAARGTFRCTVRTARMGHRRAPSVIDGRSDEAVP